MTICTQSNGFSNLRSKVKIRRRQMIRVRVTIRAIVRVMHRIRMVFLAWAITSQSEYLLYWWLV